MPELKEKKRCVHHKSNTNARARFFAQPNPPSASITNGARRQAVGFTDKQEMRLRVGDMRMARMQTCLSQLRRDMEQSKKLIEELYLEAHLDIKKI